MPITIQPKYDIGYKFWVPRCRIEIVEHSTILDGVEWIREEKNYLPYVKEKEIQSIEILITPTKKIITNYYVIDTTDIVMCGSSFSLIYSESQIKKCSEEQALIIAKKFAKDKIVHHG